MSKLIDLTGQKFGRLTVIEKDKRNAPHGSSYWICQWDCGNIKSVKSSSLRRGEIQSCGCLRNERSKQSKEELGLVDDLVGQRFGYLTVIAKNPIRAKGGAVMWDCICDCGNTTTVRGSALKCKNENRTVSCGKCHHISIGEKHIKEILNMQNINYRQEYVFQDFLNHRYDFAIFEGDKTVRLVEFDGEQHYHETTGNWPSLEIQQERDKLKNEYALSHNIPLIRIPYWERDKITLDMIMGNKYLVK